MSFLAKRQKDKKKKKKAPATTSSLSLSLPARQFQFQFSLQARPCSRRVPCRIARILQIYASEKQQVSLRFYCFFSIPDSETLNNFTLYVNVRFLLIRINVDGKLGLIKSRSIISFPFSKFLPLSGFYRYFKFNVLQPQIFVYCFAPSRKKSALVSNGFTS